VHFSKSIPEQLESSLVSRTSDSETLSQCQESHKNDDFWMEIIDHTGTSPFLNDSSYVVYRNVKDFGAKGDGAADDTAAIQRAIDGRFSTLETFFAIPSCLFDFYITTLMLLP
jgi:hypothetical protein